MILLVSGQANTGKDTLCNHLVRKHGFVKIAFADKIKRILMDLYDLSYQQLWGESKNRALFDLRYKVPESDEYLTARLGSQTIGDAGRSLYEDTWVDYTLNDIKKLHDNYTWDYEDCRGSFRNVFNFGKKNIVVSDARYFNEIKKIKDMGGKTIRIKKTVVPLKGKAGSHSSEVNQVAILDSYFDYIIFNDGSLEDLYRKIDEIIAKNT